jgi:hypothetical protein
MRRRKGTEGARHERGALLQAEPLVHAEAEALIREHRAEAYGEARQRECRRDNTCRPRRRRTSGTRRRRNSRASSVLPGAFGAR